MKKVIFTSVLSILFLPLFAQTTHEEVEYNLRSIDTLLANKSVFQSLYISPELSSIDVDDINRWAEDLKETKLSESGLELTGGYDYRFWNDDFVDDDYEDGETAPYKHRFIIAMTWNIMQSGLIDRDNFSQKVDILSRTKSQEVVNDTIKSMVIESAEQQVSNLYGYYNVLIDSKAELYSVLIKMQEELVANNKATMLSLSDLNIKRSNVLRMHKSGVEARSGVIDLENYIASQTLFVGDEYDSLLESNNTILRNRLDQELTLNEANGISYWKEISVSPFMRIYNYLDESTNRKHAGKLGFSASLPIFTNTKSKRNEVLSRGRLLANEEQVIRNDVSRQITDLLQQLNENFETLNLLIDSSKHYSESCELATEYYNNRAMTIQDLGQRYIDNIDNNIEIYKLIIEREEIKYSLYKVVYGI